MKSVMFVLYANRVDIYKELIIAISKKIHVIIFIKRTNLTTSIYDLLCDLMMYYKNYDVEILYESNYSFMDNFYYVKNHYKKRNTFLQIFKAFFLDIAYKKSKEKIRSFILKKNVKSVILNSDACLDIEIGIIDICFEFNIKCFVYSGVYLEPHYHNFIVNKDAINRYINPKNTIFEKIYFSKYKNTSQQFENYFYYNASEIAFLEKNNLLSTAPWIYGGNPKTSYLLVINQQQKDLSIKCGMLGDKIKIMGDLNYDKLYANLQKTNLKNKKTIILALPPFYEHSFLSKQDANLEIDFIFETITAIKNIELIVSLHPIMPIKEYSYLENKYNCKISTKPLSDILANADIFLSSPSNTTIWGLLCGIKTIMFDFYNWNYIENEKMKGLIICKNKEKFSNILQQTLEKDCLYMQEIAQEYRQKTKFDGKVVQGYVDIITNSTNLPTFFDCKTKYCIFFAFIYFIDYFRNLQLKQISKMIHLSDKFYIAPYSIITQDLLLNIQNKNKFAGFIDKNISKNNVFLQSEIKPDKNALIIIASPNNAKAIKNSLKNKFKHILIYKY